MPILNKLYDEYVDKINFITISLTGFRDETVESASNYYNEQNFNFPVFFDRNKSTFNSLNVQAIPTVYLVDKDGVVKKVIVESIGEAEFRSLLSEAS